MYHNYITYYKLKLKLEHYNLYNTIHFKQYIKYKYFNVTSLWYYIFYIKTKYYKFTVFVLNNQNNYVLLKLLFIIKLNIIH